jgi:hypothetical protein
MKKNKLIYIISAIIAWCSISSCSNSAKANEKRQYILVAIDSCEFEGILEHRERCKHCKDTSK